MFEELPQTSAKDIDPTIIVALARATYRSRGDLDGPARRCMVRMQRGRLVFEERGGCGGRCLTDLIEMSGVAFDKMKADKTLELLRTEFREALAAAAAHGSGATSAASVALRSLLDEQPGHGAPRRTVEEVLRTVLAEEGVVEPSPLAAALITEIAGAMHATYLARVRSNATSVLVDQRRAISKRDDSYVRPDRLDPDGPTYEKYAPGWSKSLPTILHRRILYRMVLHVTTNDAGDNGSVWPLNKWADELFPWMDTSEAVPFLDRIVLEVTDHCTDVDEVQRRGTRSFKRYVLDHMAVARVSVATEPDDGTYLGAVHDDPEIDDLVDAGLHFDPYGVGG